ncbi:MAG: glycoside hydrolase family 5 protein [bacterium]|nr:glycoside hydrolase family 5 protein [bacterium]MBU1917194.1 glycoside hydrolase family 5 protein [bacterium]
MKTICIILSSLLLLVTSCGSSVFNAPDLSDNTGPSENDTISATARYQVSGNQIYHNGNRINLFGINWFGFETNNHIFHGLWQKNYQELLDIVADLNFNALRIPLCPETLAGATATSVNTYENPELTDIDNALNLLDIMLEELNDRHIYFLLDIHRIECDAITELWYNENYSQADWIDDLVFMANRYQGLDYFMGLDLFNEPHGAATWGSGDTTTDWKMAVEEASAEILDVNDDILIFVEGIQENNLCSSTEYEHWWGGNIEPQECHAITIDASKLVLSPHVYGPDVYWQSYFSDVSFPTNMPTIWDEHFGFLTNELPIVLGEFGGKYGEGHAEDITWQNAMVDYMIDQNMCSFFYWCLNPNSGDTGGILDDDWETVKEAKYQNLCRLMEHCDNTIECN